MGADAAGRRGSYATPHNYLPNISPVMWSSTLLDDIDRHDFIKTLAEACQKTGWQVHAYCLMRNHYHLVMETPDANLVSGMAWLQSTYTIRLNNRHQLTGHVLSGRYKAQLVEGSGNGYLRTACDYVHLNPIRAKLLAPEDRLLAYPWSSDHELADGRGPEGIAVQMRDPGRIGRQVRPLQWTCHGAEGHRHQPACIQSSMPQTRPQHEGSHNDFPGQPRVCAHRERPHSYEELRPSHLKGHTLRIGQF
jgi:REP element-mobilizing transposase RayT